MSLLSPVPFGDNPNYPPSLVKLHFIYEWVKGDNIDKIADRLLTEGQAVGVCSVELPGGANFYYGVICDLPSDTTIQQIDAYIKGIINTSRKR